MPATRYRFVAERAVKDPPLLHHVMKLKEE
jgi:hypothetical protein